MELQEYIQHVLKGIEEYETQIEFDVGVYTANGKVKVDAVSQNRLKFTIYHIPKK